MLTGRTVQVLPKYGLTPEYHPTMGVEQGDTLSPTLWRIFYNALIIAIEEAKAGIKLDADSHYNETTGCIDPVMVSQVVMADDLTLLTDSREKLLKLINVIDEFMCLHNIRVHGAKTVVAIQKDTLTKEDTVNNPYIYNLAQMNPLHTLSITKNPSASLVPTSVLMDTTQHPEKSFQTLSQKLTTRSKPNP